MTNKETIIDDLIKIRVNEIVEDIVIDKVNEIVTSDLMIHIERATKDFWTSNLPLNKHRARLEIMLEAVKELAEMKHSPLKSSISRIAENCIREQYKDFSFKLQIQQKEI